MNLQLADGSLENPIGVLENVTVKLCGIEYVHTFAIVDFGSGANYEVILGRPFMRQFKMIQDWGYNYLYLRQESAITRVNLKNHSYRDVTYSPVEEFDSASSEVSHSTLSYANAKLWICDASRRSVQTDGSAWCRDVMDEAYLPIPFPEETLEPVEWSHILATIDVSSLQHPTKFCNPDGYDIIPIRMVQVIEPEESIIQTIENPQEIFVCDKEVSVHDLLSSTGYGTADEGDEDGCLEDSGHEGDDEDFDVPETELEKIRILLRGREAQELIMPKDKHKRKFCKSHRVLRKRSLKEKREREKQAEEQLDAEHFVPPIIPPEFLGKNEYLYHIGAEDCVKNEVKWRYGFQLLQKMYEKEPQNPKKKKKRVKIPKAKSTKLSDSEKGLMTKVEQKL